MAKKVTKKKEVAKRTSMEVPDSNQILGMHIKKETLNSILAIFFFLLALLFAFAGFNMGGVAGEFIYKNLKHLLGVGYVLLPVVFLLLGFSSYKTERPNFGTSNAISSILFLFSGLGIIHLIKNNSAGVVGKITSWPFVKLFDIYLAFIILLAIFIISLVVMFDRRPSFSRFKERIARLFGSRDEFDSEEELGDEEDDETRNIEPEEPQREEDPEPKIVSNQDEEKKEGFSFNTAYKSMGEYKPPPLSLLQKNDDKAVTGDIKANSNIIKRTLQNFGIDVEMDEVTVGPTVTRFALKPAQGVRLSRITTLADDLRLALAAPSIRIQAPIPGKSLVGIEVPNTKKATVDLRSLLASKDFKDNQKPLLSALGRSVSGKAEYANVAKMPHLLIAGATGSGKSVTVHTIIASLLYRNGPNAMRFIMIDPKRVELTLYNGIPHLLTPVITNPKKAILALKWAVSEMERRYDLLEKCAVRDIDSYHSQYLGKKAKEDAEAMPYILVIIDELADIMATYPRELEAGIVRLAQMSRAVGIHLILSTQRPSVNVITGLIKANVPSRIALQVASQLDSRTILDSAGAEKLLGAGDMLFASGEMAQAQRIQCAFISENEVKSITGYLREHYKNELPDDINLGDGVVSSNGSIFAQGVDDDKDELFAEAKKIVIEEKKASTSYIQRRLKIGYSRAARILDELEQAGIVGPANGAKAREILADASSIASQPKIDNNFSRPHTVTMVKEEIEEDFEDLGNDSDEETSDENDSEDYTNYEELPVNDESQEKTNDFAREDDQNTDNEYYDENDKY
ncbi:MAG: DNA translocase FtsK [Bacteroidetes bacterium]|nr:DNA translocase FtsK [Bacteroidota bacterium]